MGLDAVFDVDVGLFIIEYAVYQMVYLPLERVVCHVSAVWQDRRDGCEIRLTWHFVGIQLIIPDCPLTSHEVDVENIRLRTFY